jgi:hypothetical protein
MTSSDRLRERSSGLLRACFATVPNGDGLTMKAKIAEGSTAEVAAGVTIVCVREDRSF